MENPETWYGKSIHGEISDEVKRQREIWGPQYEHTNGTWALILGEEYGEVCQAALQHSPDTDKDDIRKELIQVAAVAVSWILALDHNAG